MSKKKPIQEQHHRESEDEGITIAIHVSRMAGHSRQRIRGIDLVENDEVDTGEFEMTPLSGRKLEIFTIKGYLAASLTLPPGTTVRFPGPRRW